MAEENAPPKTAFWPRYRARSTTACFPIKAFFRLASSPCVLKKVRYVCSFCEPIASEETT
jgi:hypothetical protein